MLTYQIMDDKIVEGGGTVKYKIGYKQEGQWKYIMIMGGLQAAMDMIEKLLLMGYTQVSIKII